MEDDLAEKKEKPQPGIEGKNILQFKEGAVREKTDIVDIKGIKNETHLTIKNATKIAVNSKISAHQSPIKDAKRRGSTRLKIKDGMFGSPHSRAKVIHSKRSRRSISANLKNSLKN